MELLGEMVIGEEGRRSTVTGIHHDPENEELFLAVGKIHDNDLHYDKPFLVRFDADLNIVWQKEVELPHNCCKFFFKQKSFMDSQNDIVSLFNTGGIFEYQDGSGDYGVCYSWETIIQRLNRNFEPVGQRNIPLNIHLDSQWEMLLMSRYDQSTVLSLPDSSLFIAVEGLGWTYPELVPDASVLMKLSPSDTLLNIYVDDFEGLFLSDCYDDYTEIVPEIKGVDRLGDYLFYCYYILDYDLETGMVGNSSFCVTKLTTGLDVIWQRVYDFNNKIRPHYVMATHDGGCLVTGEIGTGLNGEEGMMMFAVKIDSEGYLGVHEMGNMKLSVFCYPNPAEDYVRIEGVEASEVQVYNVLGQLVKTVLGTNEIDLSGLVDGVYMLRIRDKEGRIFLEKVMVR